MSPEEHIHCLHSEDWGTLWQILKEHTAHVTEGNKDGGWRDRLIMDELNNKNNCIAIAGLDKKIDSVSKDFTVKIYKTSILSGIIGGLVAVGSKDILQMFLTWFMKGWK